MQALIVAAGTGTRFGRPKALVPLAGRPLVGWSVELFRRVGAERIVVAARAEDVAELRAMFGDGVVVVPGGESRAESVRRGARHLVPGGRVLVHDAARPCLTTDLVARLLAVEADVVVPVLEVEDTLRMREGGVVDRTAYLRVQTPQAFSWQALEAVVEQGGAATDEAQVAEALGFAVRTVVGDRENLKVTWPEDLRLAEAILRARHACSPARVGLGIDIHRLVPGRRLILGGVELPPEAAGGRGLLGHSDADVVLHAVMDACLGAAGEADIGELFPPDDDRYRDADSALLLGEVRRRLRERGLVVGSVDITVVAEVPKLRPHKARLRQRLAELLEISEDRVGLKATTPERLGWLGREEGVLAVAVAELVAARCPHEV